MSNGFGEVDAICKAETIGCELPRMAATVDVTGAQRHRKSHKIIGHEFWNRRA